MPLRHVEPQVILTLVDGTEICREYKEGYWSSPLSLWYQVRDDTSDTGWTAFDVRDLGAKFKMHSLVIFEAAGAATLAGLSFLGYLHSLGIETVEGNG